MPTIVAVETETVGDGRRGQRPRQRRPQVSARAGRRHLVETAFDDPLDVGPEALGQAAGPERRDEGVAVAGVVGAVGRQHARPDHPGGREPGIVNRERRRIAQHLDGGGPPGDEEGIEGRHPRDRRGFPEPCEVRMGVAGQLVEREHYTSLSRRSAS